MASKQSAIAYPLVLGVWDGHDAGAAVVGPSGLLAAVSEERLTRIKKQGGWPTSAIEAALQVAGCTARDISQVAVAGTTGRLPARLLDGRYAAMPPQRIDPFSASSRAFAAFQNGLAQVPMLRHAERRGSAVVLGRRLAAQGLAHASVQLVDHHRAHAMAAAATLAADEGLVVTMDGYGDGVSAAFWRLQSGSLVRLQAQGPEASAALLYGALTRVLGFREGEEGKLTGLAGLGHEHATLHGGRWFATEAGRLLVRRRAAVQALRLGLRAGVDRAALARALQVPMEEAVATVIGHHLTSCGTRHLALAGGLFANVSLNGRLATLPVDELAVFPAMGDQGLCVGAALHVAGPATVCQTMPAMAAGPELAGDSDPEAVASLLASGAVVGVARGAMEFGPRALGQRSVLFDAGDPKLAARVGDALGRESFMPFAPMLRAAHWADSFATLRAPIWRASQEMVLALPVRPAFAAAAPAAVHTDDTARPQVVDPAEDPWLHQVLASFTTHTGRPALVNTSFNHHREPIVCTAREAMSAATSAGLDAVVLGGDLHLLRRASEKRGG